MDWGVMARFFYLKWRREGKRMEWWSDGVLDWWGNLMESILAGFLQIGICKSLANSGFKKGGLTGLDRV